MARNEKEWHPDFIEYIEKIVDNEAYDGLPITRSRDGRLGWTVTKKSSTGQARKKWFYEQVEKYSFTEKGRGDFDEFMRYIHPTKETCCQICGNYMSIYYVYPNANFLKSLYKKFGYEFSLCDDIDYIWDNLKDNGISKTELKKFFISKFALKNFTINNKRTEILRECEWLCRKGFKSHLGPGAMSNFPDRFDGFHSYNRCCRKTEDTGRHDDNMKTYGKDRRAFEYWSDGNIQAANKYMNSEVFKGQSADHIGPISLGFVHDPAYLVPMRGGDNSAKRDRLLREDIDNIIRTEAETTVYPMSWYSMLLWEHIKENYQGVSNTHISSTYRNALKQNMNNFMFILNQVIVETGDAGISFLINAFIAPKMEYFKYNYLFDSVAGKMIQSSRIQSANTDKEFSRFVRIAIDSVAEYSEKENRHYSHDLTHEELKLLDKVIKKIPVETNLNFMRTDFKALINFIQRRIISNI